MHIKKGVAIFVLFLSSLGSPNDDRQSQNVKTTRLDDPRKIYRDSESAFRQGDYEKALTGFRTAGRLAKDQELPNLKLFSLRHEALTLWNLGRIQDSYSLFKNALALANETSEIEVRNFSRAAMAIIELYQKAKEHRNNGQFELSLEKYSQAIAQAEQIGCDYFKVKCLRQKSIIALEQEAFETYKTTIDISIRLADRLSNFREHCLSILSLGSFYVVNVDYMQALYCFQRAYDIAARHCDAKIQADCLNNIGVCYQYLGDYDRAILYLLKILPLFSLHSDSPVIADYLINLGGAFSRRGERRGSEKDFSIAEAYLRESFRLATIANLSKTQAASLINLGYLFEIKGDTNDALEFYEKALGLNQRELSPEHICIILCNLGNLKRKLLDTKRALQLYARAETIAQEHSFNHIIWEIYLGQGLCLRNEKRYLESIKRISMAINAVEYIKGRNEWNPDILFNIDDKRQAYHEMIGALLEIDNVLDKDELIFSYIERALSKSSGGKEKQHYVKKGQLAELVTIHKNHEGSASLIALREMRKILVDDNTVILEYLLGMNKTYLFYITNKGYRVFELAGSRTIRDSISGYIKALSIQDKKYLWQRAAERIVREIVPNVGELWKGNVNHLIIIPDGILYQLPFEALKYNGRFLVEKFSISYAPFSSSLASIVNSRPNEYQKIYLGIGVGENIQKNILNAPIDKEWSMEATSDYYGYFSSGHKTLRYCRKEVTETRSLFPEGETEILLDNEATETNVKEKLLGKYRIIHFACHGILEVGNPLNSALVLRRDSLSKNDGYFQAREIARMGIKADLVLLSACESGCEYGLIGDGVMGISRAFINSGARSVIATLWKISDPATAYLIKHFIRRLLAGYDKGESLRYAKRKMIESRYANPYYWAPYILNGDFGPLTRSCPN